MTSTRILLCAALASVLAFADGVAGLKWTAPANWKNQGSRPMRAATYSVPQAAGDSEPGECVAYFFGQGQGGSVDANIQRWIGQFQDPSGKAPKSDVKKKTVHGLPVTTIDIAGTYKGGGPMMGGGSQPKPNYRMLGAIVEGPGGSVFFKFTAGAKTVAASQAAFDKMIASIDKQ